VSGTDPKRRGAQGRNRTTDTGIFSAGYARRSAVICSGIGGLGGLPVPSHRSMPQCSAGEVGQDWGSCPRLLLPMSPKPKLVRSVLWPGIVRSPMRGSCGPKLRNFGIPLRANPTCQPPENPVRFSLGRSADPEGVGTIRSGTALSGAVPSVNALVPWATNAGQRAPGMVRWIVRRQTARRGPSLAASRSGLRACIGRTPALVQLGPESRAFSNDVPLPGTCMQGPPQPGDRVLNSSPHVSNASPVVGLLVAVAPSSFVSGTTNGGDISVRIHSLQELEQIAVG
jgi:hypothetical protein